MTTTLEQMWGAWIAIAGVALAFAATLSGVVYALGSLLMNDKMKTWAKMELAEVVYSAIIIVVAIGALYMVDGVVQSSLNLLGPQGSGITNAWVRTGAGGDWGYYNICGPEIAADPMSVYHDVSGCHIRLGVYYLREIFQELSDVAFQTYVSYIYTATAADFTINIEFVFEKAGFFTFNPWRGFFTMGNNIKALVFDYAMKLMVVTKFQEVLLVFIAKAAFPAIFVAGAVMRTFTFTRRLGGLLMAMGLVLYFIYPMFYAFGALIMLNIKYGQTGTAGAYSFWCKGTDLNPLGCTSKGNPDPPIANMMYIKGAIPMPGGPTNSVDAKEMMEARRKIQGITPEGMAELKSTGKYDGDKYLLSFNLFDEQKGITQADQQKAYQQAYDSTLGYMQNVSGKDKIDWFVVNNAYSAGGPLDILGRLAFFSVFFAFFGILSCIAAIRSLSITLGGDIEIAGLTHLI